MSRARLSTPNGFALITSLWLVIVLGIVALTLVRPLVVAGRSSTNRVELAQARWAARACVALLQAQSPVPSTDSVALGGTTWCDVRSIRPDERVNPNVGDSIGLSRLLRDPVMVASLLDWIDADDRGRTAGAEADWYRSRHRPLPRNAPFKDPREIGLVRGFEDVEPQTLADVFTTRGDGTVSPNRAPRWALESISGVPTGLASSLMTVRGRRGLANAEQVAAATGVRPTIAEYQEMVRRLSFNDGVDVVRVEGHSDAGRTVLKASLIVTIETDRGRVRILRVEAEQ